MSNLKKQAVELFNNEKYEKSLSVFLSILKTNPKSKDILLYTSYNYMKMGDFKTAIIYFEKIIQVDKKLPQVYYNMGVCFNILGKNFDAIDSFKKAISLKDNYLESYIQIGQLFKKLSLLDEAIKIYKLALPKVNQKDTINVNISEVYYLQKNYQLSIRYAEDALNLNAKNYFAKINIANCLMDQGEIENGIIELEQAKVINSNSSMVFNNLGYGYKLLGNESEAITNYKKAIELNPKLHDAHFNLSHIQLAQNNFIDGWENYEYRFGTQKKFTNQLKTNKPKWDTGYGFDRILIWGEQGIGEQILFGSILPDVMSKFKKVILCVEDKLVEIFQEKFNKLEVIPLSKKIDESMFDYHLPICSLGKFFRKDLRSFLYNNDESQIDLNTQVSNRKLKCAISWKSSNENLKNIKSIALEDLKEILMIDKIDFYNIQYTNEDNEVEAFKKKYNITIHKKKGLDTFNNLNDLNEFIRTCDFVITVSNSNAHLSASIGKATYLLLPNTKGKFWYWENDENGKNVWYPSIIKFKQKTQGDWSEPIKRLKNQILGKYLS